MKKLLALTLVLCLSLGSIFVLVSCNEGSETETTEALTTVPSTEPISESTEAATTPINGIIVPGALVLLQSGNTYIRAYENSIWSDQWNEQSGWISSDGSRISVEYPSVNFYIPKITYSDNFEFHFKENITSAHFTVYNNKFEKINQGETKDVLKGLEDGTYYLVIEVVIQGEYVESEGKYEKSGYECVYKMTVGD